MSKLDGIGVALPLDYDNTDGPYRLTKNLGEEVKQNLKNLLLTSPGERVMLPTFGAGIRKMLFEPKLPATYSKIQTAINTQIVKFMPFVNIVGVTIFDESSIPELGPNDVMIQVKYNLGQASGADTLKITFSNN